MNILIVDDELLIRTLMNRLLMGRGHTVTEASDAVEGRRLALTGAFDLALLDHNMPGGDGLSIAEAIASSQGAAETRVLMCTSMSGPAYEARARQAGALGVLAKPFSLDEVLRWIEVLEAQGPTSPVGAAATRGPR